jgi:hypothetical protein
MLEAEWMDGVRDSWQLRCQELGLKPRSKAREKELCSYMQGVLSTALSAGLMTQERASRIAFLVLCGRGDDFLKPLEVA